MKTFLTLATFVSLISATQLASRAPAPSTVGSGVTVLFQNNLDWTDDKNHAGFLLLDTPLSFSDAKAACTRLGESLVLASSARTGQKDLLPQLRYAAYRGDVGPGQLFWLADGTAKAGANTLDIAEAGDSKAKLPALCTQSSRGTTQDNSLAAVNNSVSVVGARSGNTYTGYRNLKSWRFLGIPYADPTARFAYAKVSSAKGKAVDATKFGSQCLQPGGSQYRPYSEDCLALNVFTPRIPASSEAGKKLRPVIVWIHGGAFAYGTGVDPTFDGGNMASRGDVVAVTINYRLSTLGFLAIPGTNITGNYGIADQVTALQWIKANIQDFGGDPNRVTIWGQSAGGSSVRALLGSPKARGLFQAAIPASSPGGYSGGAAFSYYMTPSEEYTAVGQGILNSTGCLGAADVIGCLSRIPASTLVSLSPIGFVIVDGTYVTTRSLNVTNPRAPSASAQVPVLWGTTADDGAAFIGFPKVGASRADAVYSLLYDKPDIAAAVLADEKLFPTPNSGNATLDVFNVSTRISTDVQLRCVDQATVYSGVKNGVYDKAWYYQFERTYQLTDYSPNEPVCKPPITASHPYGDPSLPYMRCHSGDLHFEFGTLGQFSLPFRDALDLPFAQLTLDHWTAFIRSHDPNPDSGYLAARGYENTAKAVKQIGRWEQVTKKKNTLKRLDYPGRQDGFIDVEQCKVLGLPLDYFETR